MGYELLIRPRVGQPPLREEALRRWLDGARAAGLPALVAGPGAPKEAPASAPGSEAALPPTGGGAAPGSTPAAEGPAPHGLAPADLAGPPPASQGGVHAPPPGSSAPTAGDSAEPTRAPPLPAAASPRAAAGAGGGGSAKASPVPLANGKAVVNALLYWTDGQLRGADLEVPFGGTEEELRTAFDFALATAHALDATVFDPQLLREVGREALEEVVGRWRESQSWVVDVAGSGEDRRSLMAFTAPRPRLERRNKILLGLLGGLLLLYWIFGLVRDSFG